MRDEIDALVQAIGALEVGEMQRGAARRLLLSRLVIEHRLAPQDPLSLSESTWEQEAMDLLLQDQPVSLAKAQSLVG